MHKTHIRGSEKGRESDALSARVRRPAFTIVEMLIAMLITLLMMAALGRSFAVIGETIRNSRVEIDLSVQMREITRRLSEDLSRCTVRVDRPARQQEGKGYFVYYDGPLSSASGTLFGESPDATLNESTLQDAKYGDFDDYIAFTAAADKDNWFSGKVPRFILDMKDAERAGVPYDPANYGDPWEPVVITSKYAEIIYFASPEYATKPDAADPSQQIFEYDASTGSGNPLPLDVDGDLIPDNIRLHRRVLLIRPDLNLNSTGALPTRTVNHGGDSFTYMSADAWSTDTTTSHPAIKTPATHGLNMEQASRAWLIGMGVVHQHCDLSVRRVLGVGGQPTTDIAANSLADLTFPHNRFAHVRMPSSAVLLPIPSDTFGYTSMPLLALGGPHQLLIRSGTGSARSTPPFAGASTVITPILLNGFLRPEFVLGQDLTHTDFIGDGWGIERRGEDVISSNILGFDVKGFDPSAAVFLTPGPDGVYGRPAGGGFNGDDDFNGTANNVAEAGFSGSDDLAITPNDAAYFEVIRSAAIPPNSSAAVPSAPQPSIVGMRGAFVDLFYPFQAGGTLRGLVAMRRDRHFLVVEAPIDFAPNAAAARARGAAFLNSELSGYSPKNHLALDNAGSEPYRSHYTDELFKSGRLLQTPANSGGIPRIRLLQPAYDTFTDGYERDGFRQDDGRAVGGAANFGSGTLWWLNDPVTGIPPDGPSGTFRQGVDRGSSGLGLTATARETAPPLPVTMPALQVTLRMEDQNTRQLQQMSVVSYFGD